MRFTCLQTDLMGAIQTVSRAMAASRSTLQLLEGIYLKAESAGLRLKCMNMSLEIETRISASVTEEGELVLPGRLFSEIVRRLPSDEVEIRTGENAAATISSGTSRTTLQGMPASEFPSMPSFNGAEPVLLEQAMLRDMIRKTVFATAHDETKPVLTGALLELHESAALMVALDGYRLALRRETLAAEAQDYKVVIPARSLNEIAKVLGDEGDTAMYGASGYMRFTMGETSVITRLLEGEFIKYEQIMPKEYATRAIVDSGLLCAGIERASLLAREGQNNLIRLSVSEDGIAITSQSEIGNAYESLPCDFEGKELEIAFNAAYLLDVLHVIEGEKVMLDFNSSVSPLVLHPLEGDAFTYLVLPVRIY